MKNADPLIGQRLGNYLIQHPLGQGGMARVYKGLDVSLKRAVAIKVMGEGLRQSGQYAQRFEREAQSVANLRHPNIVGVFYFGSQDDLYYLVMEYIDGTDLETVMNNYADSHELMPYGDVIGILEAVASALDYAHSQGVIHRDIKPSNIMIERAGRPVLTDFGLALRLSEGTVGDTFGSPHYISPEQAQNSALAVPQSDLYSLGVIAYKMLTGTIPFDDPSPTALAMQHIMAAIPSPRAFNPQLSEQVEQVLFRSLAKRPEERYPSGATFMLELRQSLEAMLRPPQSVEMEHGTGAVQTMQHVSMQTVIDKVQQEMAMQQALGQTATRAADTGAPGKSRLSTLLPYAITTGVALILLLVVALVATSSLNSVAPSPPPPTETSQAAVNLPPTTIPAVIGQLPTNSMAPPAAVVPTDVPVLPSATIVPPTLTPLPPTETALPPSDTALPPTPSPIPPLATLALVTAPGQATPAPSDWLPVRFIYNETSFYWMNDSSRSINSQPVVFQRVGGSDQFEGRRWAYWTMESGRCMEIVFVDVSSRQRPEGCRPNAFFTPTRNQNTNFWIGAGQFRVLWNGTEIALCDNLAGLCTASVPPG